METSANSYPTLSDSVLEWTSAKNIYYIIYKAIEDSDTPRNFCKVRKYMCLPLSKYDMQDSSVCGFFLLSEALKQRIC